MVSKTEISVTLERLAKKSKVPATNEQIWLISSLLFEHGLSKPLASALIDKLKSV